MPTGEIPRKTLRQVRYLKDVAEKTANYGKHGLHKIYNIAQTITHRKNYVDLLFRKLQSTIVKTPVFVVKLTV